MEDFHKQLEDMEKKDKAFLEEIQHNGKTRSENTLTLLQSAQELIDKHNQEK